MTQKRKGSSLESREAESELERHMKLMLQDQLKVDTSIEEQFSKHRKFTTPLTYDPAAEKLIGLHDFEQHKDMKDKDSKMEYFRQCGLTEDEVLLMLKKDNDKTVSKEGKSFGADPSMEQRWLDEIKRKISSKEEDLKQPDTFKGGLELSRQSLDVEKSIIKQQIKTVILPPGIIRQKKHLPSHPDDPINHIPEIMEDINPKPEREPRRDRRRRRKLHRQMLRQQLYTQVDDCDKNKETICEENVNDSNSPFPHNSKHDTSSKDCRSNILYAPNPALGSRLMPESSLLVYPSEDCSKKFECNELDMPNRNDKAENNGKEITEITADMSFISEEEIVANRLNLEEILAIDKFSNYTAGKPNNIIFVKNLPKDTRDEDLVALFGRYKMTDDQKIFVKLLSGRMKGQAFITFQDSSTAGQAISLLNGYKLRSQPIILSYGKKKTND